MTSDQSALASRDTVAPLAATQALYALAYRSHSLVPAARADRELADILRVARVNNAARGITGALLLYDGWFAQVLEGPESAVRAIFDRIADDKRHNGVELLDQGPVEKRVFERWAMAYVGEHGDPDIPMMAVGDSVVPAADWHHKSDQDERLAQLRQATRGYGRGS